MKNRRIHITGASGAGTTTLGRLLANALSVPHHDTDDYFWLPTALPYTHIREPAERLRLMQALFLPRTQWVLSGSLQGWGDPVATHFDLVVFLYTEKAVRLQRLRARESARYGADAVVSGGWRHKETEDFIAWASRYDDGDSVSRTFDQHQVWLASLPCPVLRLDGARPLSDLLRETMAVLEA